MKKILVLAMGLGLVGLTGCSELQVIKSATMRELSAEAVSLETLALQKEPAQAKDDILVVPDLTPAKRTVVAKVEYNPFLAGAGQATALPRKGLWSEGK